MSFQTLLAKVTSLRRLSHRELELTDLSLVDPGKLLGIANRSGKRSAYGRSPASPGARSSVRMFRPIKTSLLIVGHGTRPSTRSSAGTAAQCQVRAIRDKGLYAEVSEAYMEEAPFIADWRQNTTQPNVVVVPFFIADGLHSYLGYPCSARHRVSAALPLLPVSSEVFRRNPYFYTAGCGNFTMRALLASEPCDGGRYSRHHRSI